MPGFFAEFTPSAAEGLRMKTLPSMTTVKMP